MRNSARKSLHNHIVKSRMHNLEKKYLELLGTGKKEDAAATYRKLSSVLDKAAKAGVIHKARANRSKSRLGVRLRAAAVAPAPAK